MLVVGKSAEARADLDRLVSACRIDEQRLRVAPARALEAIGADEDWDVLLIHLDAAVGEMGAALRRREAWEGRVPIVLLANQLSAEVATLAHSYGARVCLIEHGADPLRLALLAAADDAVAYREQRESAEASEQIAMVHSSISDVIFHLRVEGERFRFVEVNAAFLRATGLAEEQVVGKFVDEVIPEPSLAKVLGRYRRAINERRTVRWEEVTPYPAGTKFRVCQEALTNVARHAGAHRVEVSVTKSETTIVLQVRDDGRGITPTEIENPRSFGLVGMRERARRLGGNVALQPGEPRGTVLTLTVPVAGSAV